MDIDVFTKQVRDTSLTKEQLSTMRQNAFTKGKLDFVEIVEEELNRRFPSWNKKITSGPTPTTAIFKTQKKNFPNGKEAYLWLVEMFITVKPDLLENQQRWHEQAFKGSKQLYFARKPTDLFPERPDLSKINGNFGKLKGGWFANTLSNHNHKFEILVGLGCICGLRYPTDWDFHVIGATDALAQNQQKNIEITKHFEELIKEFEEFENLLD